MFNKQFNVKILPLCHPFGALRSMNHLIIALSIMIAAFSSLLVDEIRSHLKQSYCLSLVVPQRLYFYTEVDLSHFLPRTSTYKKRVTISNSYSYGKL
jgi:hypothetical protein